MAINSITGSMPSLVDYLNQDKGSTSNLFDYRSSQQVTDILSLANTQGAQSDAYVIDISPEAQEMLKQEQAQSGNQSLQNAQAHFLSFFEESGIDLDALSGEAAELLSGMLAFIAESGATGRDAKTDALEAQVSEGKRDVYTLTGSERRIRLAIEDDNAGQKVLTLTDLYDNTADIAAFSIEKNEAGDDVIKLVRSNETFTNDKRTDRQEQPPITLKV